MKHITRLKKIFCVCGTVLLHEVRSSNVQYKILESMSYIPVQYRIPLHTIISGYDTKIYWSYDYERKSF